MYLVHGSGTDKTPGLERARTPVTCPDCGHPTASSVTSPVARLAHRMRHEGSCHFAEYEYVVLRDGCCGCTSTTHAD